MLPLTIVFILIISGCQDSDGSGVETSRDDIRTEDSLRVDASVDGSEIADLSSNSAECRSPKVDCPCDPRKDSLCCIELDLGLSCVGTAAPVWNYIHGCGCIPDPSCGIDMAPTCNGTDDR